MSFIDTNGLSFYRVQNLSCAPEGPRAVPLNLDFSLTDTYELDLQNVQARVLITEVQAIYWDNRASSTPLIVRLPTTDQTLEFEAGTMGYMSVLCADPAKLVFTSSGSAIVKVKLLNFPVVNVIWPCGGTSSVLPEIVASVSRSNQTATLTFSLLPAGLTTGLYELQDLIRFLVGDTTTKFDYTVTWDDGTGVQSTGGMTNNNADIGSGSFAGQTLPGITPPIILYAVSGTPIVVTITIHATSVGTVDIETGPLAFYGGGGYAPGDTGTLNDGDLTATYTVTTVGAGGVVTGVTCAGGTTYTNPLGLSATIVVTGAGDGTLRIIYSATAGIVTSGIVETLAGFGYAPGDTVNIVSGSPLALLTIDTIDAHSGVATFTVTDPGGGYTVANGYTTSAVTGTGADLIVDISALSTDAVYSYNATLTRLQ